DLVRARNHREEDADTAERAGAQDRAELRLEDVRQLERDADRAPAEEGVLLAREVQVARILVGPDVERADGDRLAVELAHEAGIYLVLLLLVGEVAIREERELGAIEPDPVRAVTRDERQIGDQPDVRVEVHAAT